jgi:hypothetical protein
VRAKNGERKNYKENGQKMLFMKIFHWDNIVIGLLVLMFAVILAVDAILVTWGQPGIPLSGNDVKGITGVTFVLIAIYMLIKAREANRNRPTNITMLGATELIAALRARPSKMRAFS